MYIKQVVHECPIVKGSGFDFRRSPNKIFWSSCLQTEFVSQLLKIQLLHCTYNWSIFNNIGLQTNFFSLCSQHLQLMERSYNHIIRIELTIGSYISVRSSRYEAHGKFGELERCIRVSRGIAKSNSSFLSALQTCQVLHISMNTVSWRVNQLFYNIFNLMENFFFRGICLLTSWACTIGIWSMLLQ